MIVLPILLGLSAKDVDGQPSTPATGEHPDESARALIDDANIQRRGRTSYDSARRSNTPFYQPPILRSANGRLAAEMTIKYRKTTFNGAAVNLRSYSDQLHGPTLMIKPGDVMQIRVRNELPPDVGHLNTTNLHTHGLQVSPEDNSDNVFLAIKPGGVTDFEFKVPAWHAPGTHWYHAHSHGSTAVQVSSGTAGALLMEGGLDSIPQIQRTKDLLFLLQQIPYDETGAIESIEQVQRWGELGRETTINGQLQPVLSMAPGEIQRWRMIHAGVAEKLELEIREGEGTTLRPLIEIAADGIPLDRKRSTLRLELGPGYRSDVLFQAPSAPGKYYLVDRRSPAANNFRKRVAKPDRYLMQIDVVGTAVTMDLPDDAALAAAPKPPAIGSAPVAAVQKIEFSGGDESLTAKINGKSFSPTRTNIAVEVDTVEEWLLSTNQNPPVNSPHPFHVHVNPFYVELTDPENGSRYSTWKDTLLVDNTPIKIKMKFAKEFPGKTVFHCHRLDHEDHGMMAVLRINVKTTPAPSGPTNSADARSGPTWKLNDLHGEVWSREQFVGRPLLLVFHRGLGCLHCVEQIALLKKNLAALEEHNFRVVLVSTDDAANVKQSLKNYGLDMPFLLLPDPQQKVFESFGCARPAPSAPQHGVFVHDSQGVIRWSHRSEEALLDMRRVLAACADAVNASPATATDRGNIPR